jgi:Fe-S cluster biogenesis protein NfuA
VTNTTLIESIIEHVRPALNADGGDIELLGVTATHVRVRLTGACAGCPSAEMTLRLGIESAIRRVRPDLRVINEPVAIPAAVGGAR